MSVAKMKKDAALRRSVHLINAKALRVLGEAVKETIRDHAWTGDPVVIWRNGKVTWTQAKKLRQQQSRSRKK